MTAKLTLAALMILSVGVWAEGFDDPDRDLAAVGGATYVPVKAKPFPGGADEEDIKIQSALPEIPQSADSKTVQREVYKDLFNQDLKDERTDNIEE